MSRKSRNWIVPSAVAALMLVAALPAAAAEQIYTYTVTAYGGLGGSLDADPGDGIDNTGYQVAFSMVTEPNTRVAVRAGQLGLSDADELYGTLTDADLTYVTLSGEYQFPESWYESWTYVGLGGYRVEGQGFDGEASDTGVGIVLGLVGEFSLSRDLDFVIEISGHYADLDEANVFAMGHAGVSWHF